MSRLTLPSYIVTLILTLNKFHKQANKQILDVYWRKRPNRQAHLELCHKNPDILDVIQLNCEEVLTYASYKTTRIWENFKNRGTKMILFSDELWSIANSSKSFANGSKSIIRSNLGFWKPFEITIFRTLKNIVIDLML